MGYLGKCFLPDKPIVVGWREDGMQIVYAKRTVDRGRFSHTLTEWQKATHTHVLNCAPSSIPHFPCY